VLACPECPGSPGQDAGGVELPGHAGHGKTKKVRNEGRPLDELFGPPPSIAIARTWRSQGRKARCAVREGSICAAARPRTGRGRAAGRQQHRRPVPARRSGGHAGRFGEHQMVSNGLTPVLRPGTAIRRSRPKAEVALASSVARKRPLGANSTLRTGASRKWTVGRPHVQNAPP